MARILLEPRQGTMHARIFEVPAFPDESFSLNLPEAIGDAARPVWQGAVRPEWAQGKDGEWSCAARLEGELSYCLTVTPGEETVDIRMELKNESARAWSQSLAFTCFNCGSSASVHDRECVRHWVRTDGALRRLVEVPRKFGPRPTVQLYSVEGAPRGDELPFVANFGATPDVVLEGWLAIESRDGGRLAAVVSRPALFLFQNMEYSCIHSCPSFGALEPGRSGKALTRLYLARGTVPKWYERMRSELG